MRGYRGRLLAPALLAALVATGCKDPTGGTTVSVKPAFLPVTFTIDSSGKISVSADASIVTPLGEVSVSGFQRELGNPKPYLVAAIRHLEGSTTSGANAAVDRTTGAVHSAYAPDPDYAEVAESSSTVYSLYRIEANGRHVRPALNGQPLALAKSGTIVVDATHTQPGRVTQLQIADAPEQQHSPVPAGTASSCAGTEAIGITLPEVSAGADVTGTVTELAADCLQVQYVAEPADGVAEGTVARVVIPVDGAADAVQLPRVDDGAPGPGDRVTVSRRTPATVYVAAPAPAPSPSGSGETPGQPSDEPSESAVPGTTQVEGAAYAPVRTSPGTAGERTSHIEAGGHYPALCMTHGETVQAHGYTSDVWAELALSAGGTGWVTATALTGGPDGLSLPECSDTGTASGTPSPTASDAVPTG
ncbi:hypothetical protein AB0I51_23260 [Streptomyces sp. NPDC050549]|uniref:hypothetical protein n=1 Tax=Streptomyces sp. NPDC050549 TaxID=3155406 RepID=UPI003446026B